MAAGHGQVAAMQALVELGADMEAKTDLGTTPLHIAMLFAQAEATQALVKLGAYVDVDSVWRSDDGEMVLDCMADHGQTDAMQALLELGHSHHEHVKVMFAFVTLLLMLLCMLGISCHLPPRSLRKKARRQRGAAKAPSPTRRRSNEHRQPDVQVGLTFTAMTYARCTSHTAS